MAALAGSTVLTCPVCGRELPPVQIRLSQRTSSGDRNLNLNISVEPVFDDEWHRLVRAEHAQCVESSQR